jgi:hypothetical protein
MKNHTLIEKIEAKRFVLIDFKRVFTTYPQGKTAFLRFFTKKPIGL